ncbi:MAG: hypothetical protein KDA99_27905, partial [Planctomycetales bacterium]|nr:hypothetical protein [Planctomycetales bacterium]
MAKGAPKSRIERVFLGWRQFALPAAVHCLFERVTTQQLTDFSGYTLVVPGGRARRRLHELLVAEGERRNVAFFPPQVMTAGQLPEELYRPRRPFADELVQQLAWTEAVKKTDRSLLARIVRNPSGTAASMSSADWLMLGRILQRQYRELAADGLSFADVAEKGVDVPTFQEADRWQALAMVQETYLRLLDELGLWDQQTARLVAVRHRECHTDRRLVLVGTVDLNRTIRQMLDQVDDRVTALIYAPHELSERFDAHGCIRDDVWNETGIDLSDDAIVVADGPADQARAVMLTLDEFDGKYAAADITLGIPDEAIIPHLQRAAYDLGLRVRWGPGRPIQETAPFQLLARTAAFLESEATAEFAELARHPDFEVFVCQHGAPSGWLSELDRYRAERLPGRLSDSSFEGDSVPAGLVAAWTTTAKLLHEFMSGRRPMSQWSSPILDLLLAVYGDQQRDPEHEQHRQILRACRALDDALMQFDYIPAPLDHPVTGAEAIRLVLQRCSSVRVPPPSDPEAIEMVGWLELTLDDAPALVVTTFNEGYVPQSMNADLFLPDTIRHRLGMEDNI